jgi:UDP-GlcNAc:undecaprenyl-phosphate GlcNAc-1-phosphate transferase
VYNFASLFLIHIIINLIILFYFDYLKKKINIFDYPDKKRKLHNKPVPLLGGLILLLNIICFIFINFFKLPTLEINIILCSVIFLFVGIADDKYNLSPKVKFLLLIISLLIFFYLNEDMLINHLNIYNYSINLPLNTRIFFSILCVLLFVNALNLFDGINLQSSLYSIFFLFYLFCQGASQEIIFTVMISLFLIIYLNMINKVFMGDSGTLFLGCLISLLVIKNYQVAYFFGIDEIFLLMMLPGLDMFRLFVQRLYNKKNPFSGDREHIHHYFSRIYGYKFSIFFVIILSIIPILLNFIFSSQFIIIFFIIFYLILINYLKIKINQRAI